MSVSLSLPGVVKAALRRGLDLVAAGRGGKGLKKETIDAARRGLKSGKWPPDKWIKASAWLARHKVDRRPGWNKKGSESPGYTAWCLWGDIGDGKGRAAIVARAEKIKLERKKMKREALIESLAKQIESGKTSVAEAVMELPDSLEVRDYLWMVASDGEAHAKDFAFSIPAGKPSEAPRFDCWTEMILAGEVVFSVGMSAGGEWEHKFVRLKHAFDQESGRPAFSDPEFVEIKYSQKVVAPVSEQKTESVSVDDLVYQLNEAATPELIERAGAVLHDLSGRVPGADKLGVALSRARIRLALT